MNYDLIKKNLQTYEEAKELFPIISDYEKGEVTRMGLSKFGLIQFASFYEFKKRAEENGFELIDNVNYHKHLKPLIIQHTKTERFKTYIKNRTQKEFIAIFNDYKKFDRLLNGRITNRSRRRIRRSHEKIEGLSHCIIPIVNYFISNNIESSVLDMDGVLAADVAWYTTHELSYNDVPKKEMELTREMIVNFVDVIDNSKIDYRKLNLDVILETLGTKVKSLMTIPLGTNIKAKRGLVIGNTQILTPENIYVVRSSYVSQGRLKVQVENDNGRIDFYDYRYFEDMQIHRDNLLDQLLS